ncbi:MAG TPA: YkgJ family cysteine cluster protein [Terriglobales bacterium]|jgi:Fe-S-cluster containining protein|nr:YkgJ family cysteine cluster protein [Terriglobales bacterium]
MTEPAAQTVAVEFALKVGDGQLKASVTVPSGQTNITELLPIIQSFENAIVGKAASEAEAAGTPISCRAGCGACCRQMVPVSIFEAQAMCDWIRSLPDPQQKALEARFHQTLLKLKDTGIIQRLIEEDWFADNDTALKMAIDYFRLGIPCPFLVDESCSIHPIRPLSCREYLVTSPPELCNDPAKDGVAGVQLPIKLSRALYRMGGQLEQDRRGWIPLVFLFAWMKSGAEPGAAFSGTGQEVFHQFLEHLASTPQKPEPTPV